MPRTTAVQRGLALETMDIKEGTSITIEEAAIIIAIDLLSKAIETRCNPHLIGVHHILHEITIMAATAPILIMVAEGTETVLSTLETVEITTENREEAVEVGKDTLLLIEIIINLVQATETTTVMIDTKADINPEVDSAEVMTSEEDSTAVDLEVTTVEAVSAVVSEEAEVAAQERKMMFLIDTLSIKTKLSKPQLHTNNIQAATITALSKAETILSNLSRLTLAIKAMITPKVTTRRSIPASLYHNQATMSPLTSELGLILLTRNFE
jgi:hypothetical protein